MRNVEGADVISLKKISFTILGFLNYHRWIRDNFIDDQVEEFLRVWAIS